MVFINSQKFACESCIKGHRSSSCNHPERPLFEIKKKGRPVSQCEKCRELRKTRKMHSRCMCKVEEQSQKAPARIIQGSSKFKRYIPLVPELPNGVKDMIEGQSQAAPRIEPGLFSDPCACESPCLCHPNASEHDSLDKARAVNGLATLALAARLCSNQYDKQTPRMVVVANAHTDKRSRDDVSRPPSPHRNKRERNCAPPTSPFTSPVTMEGRVNLPPLLHPSSFLDGTFPMNTESSFAMPTFPNIPPLSTITQLAGSGCCCGLDCSCPGCVEHRGPEHVSEDDVDCADGCGTCVDHEGGIELPSPTIYDAAGSKAATSFIDQFFARAAALPPPPSKRIAGLALDPTNVTVYPSILFGSALEPDRGAAFGLVRLPKLQCCSGRCGCPDDQCGCGKTCDGCCLGDTNIGIHNMPGNVMDVGKNADHMSSVTPVSRDAEESACCHKRLHAMETGL